MPDNSIRIANAFKGILKLERSDQVAIADYVDVSNSSGVVTQEMSDAALDLVVDISELEESDKANLFERIRPILPSGTRSTRLIPDDVLSEQSSQLLDTEADLEPEDLALLAAIVIGHRLKGQPFKSSDVNDTLEEFGRERLKLVTRKVDSLAENGFFELDPPVKQGGHRKFFLTTDAEDKVRELLDDNDSQTTTGGGVTAL